MTNLQVQYSTLEASAQKADATAEAFAQQLSALQATVTAMVWQGQSGTAFQGYFDSMKQQLMPVQQTLHQLAQQIRGAANNLRESDQAVAQGFRG